MGKLIEDVKNAGLIKQLSEDLTEEELKSFDSWLESTIGPIESLVNLIHNLGSTEESAEVLASTLNHILSPGGAKN